MFNTEAVVIMGRTKGLPMRSPVENSTTKDLVLARMEDQEAVAQIWLIRHRGAHSGMEGPIMVMIYSYLLICLFLSSCLLLHFRRPQNVGG